MTSTESIFQTMRIFKAPPIPTQKIQAPTLEQLNASNPERRAIALGAMVVGPAGMLFALICLVLMPPAPPSAAEVARANHILTVADGPGATAEAVTPPAETRKNPWLPDPDNGVSTEEAARKDTKTVALAEPKAEPKVLKGKDGSGSGRTKELRLGEPAPAPAPRKAAPASPAAAPAPVKAQPSKLDGDDDLKKPTLD